MRLETDLKQGDAGGVNVLMYHSISDSYGPTSISPELFRMQIETLAELGYATVSVAAFNSWLSGQCDMPSRRIWITFDDGFADFAENAFPILRANGYTATVYLPSAKMGGLEDWKGANSPRRKLMTWQTVDGLAKEGMDFGGHSCSHANLTTLPLHELRHEIEQCRKEMENKLGFTPLSFAPPYGCSGTREREEIQKWFSLSVGTRFARATQASDRYEIPRIEMHYFRSPRRWRDFVSGRGEWYFRTRKVLREARAFIAAR